MEQLVNILQYLKNHPEVTWSGAGLTGLAVLYFVVSKVLAPLFCKGKGKACTSSVRVQQKVKGNNNIVTGTGDVKVKQR